MLLQPERAAADRDSTASQVSPTSYRVDSPNGGHLTERDAASLELWGPCLEEALQRPPTARVTRLFSERLFQRGDVIQEFGEPVSLVCLIREGAVALRVPQLRRDVQPAGGEDRTRAGAGELLEVAHVLSGGAVGDEALLELGAGEVQGLGSYGAHRATMTAPARSSWVSAPKASAPVARYTAVALDRVTALVASPLDMVTKLPTALATADPMDALSPLLAAAARRHAHHESVATRALDLHRLTAAQVPAVLCAQHDPYRQGLSGPSFPPSPSSPPSPWPEAKPVREPWRAQEELTHKARRRQNGRGGKRAEVDAIIRPSTAGAAPRRRHLAASAGSSAPPRMPPPPAIPPRRQVLSNPHSFATVEVARLLHRQGHDK